MIAKYLAQNLVTLRASRRLTQEALAKLSGVPRSTITHIESGAGNPSLRNLCLLSEALRVSIEELLARPRGGCLLVKADRIHVESRARGSAQLFKLLPDPIPGMELDRLELMPGAKMAGVPHLPNTNEYLTCMEGSITVHLAGESYDLEAGDVLAFQGNQPHSYQNTGSGKATCVSVVVFAPGKSL